MKLFSQTASIATARAFAIYSLVPYLGIVFCPGAVVIGGLSLIQSYQNSESSKRSSSYLCIAVGSLLLIVQLVLWWILYKVPEWTKGS